MKKLSEILTGPDRWWQGDFVGPDDRLCLVGALGRLLDNIELENMGEHPEYVRLQRVIGLNTEEVVSVWNDRPERTWDEVAAVIAEYDADRMLNP